MTHAGKGIDKDGNLKVEIEVEGNVPLVEPRATIVVKPYTGNKDTFHLVLSINITCLQELDFLHFV